MRTASICQRGSSPRQSRRSLTGHAELDAAWPVTTALPSPRPRQGQPGIRPFTDRATESRCLTKRTTTAHHRRLELPVTEANLRALMVRDGVTSPTDP